MINPTDVVKCDHLFEKILEWVRERLKVSLLSPDEVHRGHQHPGEKFLLIEIEHPTGDLRTLHEEWLKL